MMSLKHPAPVKILSMMITATGDGFVILCLNKNIIDSKSLIYTLESSQYFFFS